MTTVRLLRLLLQQSPQAQKQCPILNSSIIRRHLLIESIFKVSNNDNQVGESDSPSLSLFSFRVDTGSLVLFSLLAAPFLADAECCRSSAGETVVGESPTVVCAAGLFSWTQSRSTSNSKPSVNVDSIKSWTKRLRSWQVLGSRRSCNTLPSL